MVTLSSETSSIKPASTLLEESVATGISCAVALAATCLKSNNESITFATSSAFSALTSVVVEVAMFGASSSSPLY